MESLDTQTELLSRIDLIESMLQEGRRSTGRWGGVFVLWGAAYLIAIGWSSTTARPQLAWPVTMISAAILSVLISRRASEHAPRKPVSKAIGDIWTAIGLSLFLFCFAVGFSGHMEPHSYMAAIETLLGAANLSSSLILRWRAQFVVAMLWWISAVATCFVALPYLMPILILDTVVCLIGFGLYLMIGERREQHA